MRDRLRSVRKITWWIVGGLTSVALGLGAYLMYTLRCGLMGCSEVVVEQAVPAPGGALTAWLVSEVGAGATGEHNLVVYVGATGADPIRTRQAPVLWLEDALDLTLRWTGRTQLVVEYPAKADVEAEEQRLGDVTVTYMPMDTLETSWLRERAAAAKDMHLVPAPPSSLKGRPPSAR